MPRFYFDIREDGTSIEDEEGIDLADVNAAQKEAVKSVAEIGHAVLPETGLRSVSIDVRDRNGDHVLSATLTLDVTHAGDHSQDGKGRGRSGDEEQGAGPP